ncbi:MAG TPA: GrpB family protein [Acetivibrio sp.]|nr:GrpB family protein [Clostridium sp.]HOQ02102.1 GrpB family protein [Acetivibrio clariflavus]HQA57526.1 GrpB family protein [Acetivibrio sp.]
MKKLSEMSNEELWRLFPIKITEYNKDWPRLYSEEKLYIEKVIGAENIFRINHYGSTSIPGMLAKPTIDILLEVFEHVENDYIIRKMEEIGYIYSPQVDNPPPHMMFLKGYTPEGFKGQAYHVHVRYPGDWDELYFRDYLISNPDLAKRYGELKLELKKIYEFNRDGYTEAKSKFIKEVTQVAKNQLKGKYIPTFNL